MQCHPLWQEIQQLETLEQETVNPIYEVANKLRQEGKKQRALELYDQVLAINPNHFSTLMPLAKGYLEVKNFDKASEFYILTAAVIVPAIISFVGLGVYLVSTPCPAGKQKVSGIVCVADKSRISRGDRTFFANLKNTNRDLGIQAFKKGDYTNAALIFKKAVADNHNDPEVLIYYNNALARQQKTSTLTLATVVPVDNNSESAQETLRGVAQAQDQFNKKGGFNGRLLEIVIANDGDEPNKAKQVAQQLVKDQSVLGVIGHDSSDATRAALAEYEKAQLPIISPTSSSEFLNSNVFFRTVPSNEVSGKKLAEYAFKRLSLKTVVIFYNPDSSYSNSMREEFQRQFEQLGGKVVRPLIDLTAPKLNVEIEVERSVYKYKAQAGVLFPDTLHTYVAVEIAKANKKLIDQDRQGLKLLGGFSLYSYQTLIQGRDAVEDLVIEVPWFREVPKAREFAKKARQQWGGEVSWSTATSFDATQAFIQVFIESLSSSSKPSRTTVLQKLPNIKLQASDTSGYPLQFQDGERRQTEVIIMKVEKGYFVVVPEQ